MKKMGAVISYGEACSDNGYCFLSAACPEKKKHNIYVFRFYVKRISLRFIHVMENLHEICESCLNGAYELEMIEVVQRLEVAEQKKDTLFFQSLPVPARQFVGDLLDMRSKDFIFTFEVLPKSFDHTCISL